MEREKLTPTGAEEIRRINAAFPGLVWKTCRICGGLCPFDLFGTGNRHLTCQEAEKAPATRINKKRKAENQPGLF